MSQLSTKQTSEADNETKTMAAQKVAADFITYPGISANCDEYVCVSVCLSVRSHISETTWPNITSVVHVAYNRGSTFV